MTIFKNHAGLALSNSRLRIVEVNYKENKFYLENADEEFLGDFLNPGEKETKLVSVLQSAFDELVLRKPLKCSNISFTLPSNFYRVAEIPYDKNLVKKDLAEHFKWEFSILFPGVDIEELLIRQVFIKTDKGKQGKVLLIALNKTIAKSIHEFTVRNNLALKFIDHPHAAANNLIMTENSSIENKKFISLLIGDKSYSLMLIDEKQPFYLKVHQVQNSTEIIDKLSEEFDKINYTIPGIKNFSGKYIFGENISSNLLDNLSSNFGLEFNKINPFKNFSVTGKVDSSEYYLTKNNSFVPAAGIALRMI